MMLCISLAALVSEDDVQSFETIYEENKDMLYRYAYSILKDNAGAEDAVQDAFVALADNFEKTYTMDQSKIRSYMVVIVRNAAFRIYNRRKKETPAEEFYTADEPSGEEIHIGIESEELRRILFDKIRSLDPKYGDLIMLRYYHKMPEKDIANSLGISVENVKVRLFRARNMLKDMLREGGYCER